MGSRTKEVAGWQHNTIYLYNNNKKRDCGIIFPLSYIFFLFISLFLLIALYRSVLEKKLCILTCLYNCKSLFRVCACVYCKSQCDMKKKKR